MEKINITTERIKLDQFLQLAGVTISGGETKILLAQKLIKTNGQLESARRRQLKDGDIVEIIGEGKWQVAATNN